MNPPDPKPNGLPKLGQNDSSGRRPISDPDGVPKPEVRPNRKEKPKFQDLGNWIFKIEYAKAIAAARKLRHLNLPESSLERAARNLAAEKTKKRLREVLRYAENSAKSEIIKDEDILTEVLPDFGITTKLCPKASKRKGPKGRKKGGNHGA